MKSRDGSVRYWKKRWRGVVQVAADPSGLMYADVCSPLTVRTNMPKEPHPVVPRTSCRLSLKVPVPENQAGDLPTQESFN